MSAVACLSFKPLAKGSLLGFADFTYGSIALRGCSVHQLNGKRWIGLPGKPQLNAEGQPLRDDRGKIKYMAVAEWSNRAAADKFRDAALAALDRYLAQAPGARP